MRLYTLVIAAAFFCLVSAALRDAVFYACFLEKKEEQIFLSYSAKKFIAQSFKKTCQGYGFKSLEQWQLACKSLFTLDSISYQVCEEEGLMYAQWTGNGKYVNCSAQVFCKIKEGGSL